MVEMADTMNTNKAKSLRLRTIGMSKAEKLNLLISEIDGLNNRIMELESRLKATKNA